MGITTLTTHDGDTLQGVILARRDALVLVNAQGEVTEYPEGSVGVYTDATVDTPTYGLIAIAIRQQVNKIDSYLLNRRQHPSYGYTKTMIREEYHHLRGLGHAFALVTDRGTTDSAGDAALVRLIGYEQMTLLIDRVRGRTSRWWR